MAKRRRQRRRPPGTPNGVDTATANGALPGGGAEATEKSARTPPVKSDARQRTDRRPAQARFAALDLGTNNCRLLIASPRPKGFRVFDAFSRIVRLGEGVSGSGALSKAAMDRTIDALKVCADKIEKRGVTRQRCIATQACRAASNGPEFLDRVRDETGLEFEIITPAEEARLAVTGCVELFDRDASAGLIFDIGGGSTEISWVRPRDGENGAATEIAAWTSLPIGVVNLSERFGGRDISSDVYRSVVDAVRKEIAAFGDPAGLKGAFMAGEAHFLGTSGTVTSIAGVHLRLPRYRRDAVDGLWLSEIDVRGATERLRAMSYEERADEPCIGVERADLVVCGCAILDALLLEWPSSRIRVADRGLREGILVGLSRAHNRERERRRIRRRRRGAPPAA
ncbi:MAG: Ppx/GppA family phosphatase [Parvularculaceae bacterium]|nr:Ppx/GppA family phosphatase [Parvularculaceae bacterium]